MKLFGIGLSKTGTTSLAAALEILGYRVKDYPGITTYEPGNLGSIDQRVLDEYDALTDTPIPSFYRELDQRYPGSRFILTVRDMEGWLMSCRKQFTPKSAEKQSDAHNRLFVDLYGTPTFEEEGFRRGYQRFVESVLQHFANRPNDLLLLNVAAGEGWRELCAFLDKPVPEIPFPKANVTRIQWMDVHELAAIAREAGQVLLASHHGTASGTAAAPPVSLGKLVRRAVYTLGGGRSYALQSATVAALKTVARRLERLNPGIPVVTRLAHDVAAADRRQWNHFWLVDPLDGEAGFGTSDGEFTVNIALVEDGKPIVGVVHAPLSDTTYLAMAGKGAFKLVGEAAAVRLAYQDGGALTCGTPPEGPSTALTLCRCLEAGIAWDNTLAGSMEWQTAPAHALGRIIGRRILVKGLPSEVAYNKADWRNPRLVVA